MTLCRVALPALLWLLSTAAPADAATLTEAQQRQLLAEAQGAYDRGVAARRNDPAAAGAAFTEAAARFEQLVDAGVVNGRLHYNLANAYLQAGELGEAILHYRIAETLIPGDPRLEHNLESARAMRRSRIPLSGERALAGALLGWMRDIGLEARFNFLLVAYLGCWSLLAWHVIRPRPVLAWLAAAAAVLWMAAGASVAADLWLGGDVAGVVLAEEVIVRKGNSEGFEPQFEEPLSEGVEFRLLRQRGGWYLIELPNEKTGWIRAEAGGLVKDARL